MEEDSPIAERSHTLEMDFSGRALFNSATEVLKLLRDKGYNTDKLTGCYSTGYGCFAVTSVNQA